MRHVGREEALRVSCSWPRSRDSSAGQTDSAFMAVAPGGPLEGRLLYRQIRYHHDTFVPRSIVIVETLAVKPLHVRGDF